MTIDSVGWTTRPNPVQNDGKRREQPKRKLPKRKPPQDSGKGQEGQGRIDELA